MTANNSEGAVVGDRIASRSIVRIVIAKGIVAGVVLVTVKRARVIRQRPVFCNVVVFVNPLGTIELNAHLRCVVNVVMSDTIQNVRSQFHRGLGG